MLSHSLAIVTTKTPVDHSPPPFTTSFLALFPRKTHCVNTAMIFLSSHPHFLMDFNGPCFLPSLLKLFLCRSWTTFILSGPLGTGRHYLNLPVGLDTVGSACLPDSLCSLGSCHTTLLAVCESSGFHTRGFLCCLHLLPFTSFGLPLVVRASHSLSLFLGGLIESHVFKLLYASGLAFSWVPDSYINYLLHITIEPLKLNMTKWELLMEFCFSSHSCGTLSWCGVPPSVHILQTRAWESLLIASFFSHL